MKHLIKLVACIAILLTALTIPAQDRGQKIRISQNGSVLGMYGVTGNPAITGSPVPISINSAGALTFESVDAIPNTVGNRSCEGVTNGICGWYKSFWIFGDGNYKNFIDNNSQLDAQSHTYTNYRYAQDGAYTPVVYLTEKYHNTRPPEEARATINVSGLGASGTYTEITQRFSGVTDRKIDIDYNHVPRVDYPMNFVLSYPRSEPASRVLFYYNSLATNNFGTYAPTHLFSFLKNESTNYQGSGYAPDTILNLASSRTETNGTILDALNSKFMSRLSYNVSDFSKPLPSGMTEMRVFPVIQALPPTSMPTGLLTESPTVRFASFATILIGADSISPLDPAYGTLIKNSTLLFGKLNSLQLGPNNPSFIRGIQILNMKMETSHDPNSLIVDKIEDLGAGSFRVTFKLTICNQGQGNETNPSLIFNDLTGGKYSSQPQLGNIGAVTPSWFGGAAGRSWGVGLPGFVISGVPANHDPSCREIFFTINTDAEGIGHLYQENPRALQVCVNFSAGLGECCFNDPLSTTKDGKGPIVCPDCPKCCNGLLLIILLAIIATFLVWFLLKGKKM